MDLEQRQVTSYEGWDAGLIRLPEPHVLQSWVWGQLKEAYGWRAERWVWTSGDRLVAAAQILERRWPANPAFPGARLFYVPKGPILDWSAEATARSVLSDLTRQAAQRGAIFIKIDPDVPDDGSATGLGGRLAGQLSADGWIPSREQVQFRSTFRMDLSRTEDEILAGMKPKTRYNIRLAERRGVRVRPAGPDDLDLLYAMYTETAVRDGFVIRPRGYYLNAWGLPLRAGRARPFVAEVDGVPVAGLILFHFGSTAWYFYGMSRATHRDHMPSHLLQWEAIRWAKGRGCRTYDFWGAPDTTDPSDPMFGVYRFKAGFGADHVRMMGAWDFPSRPNLYRLYAVVLPKVLGVLRARQRVRTRRSFDPLGA